MTLPQRTGWSATLGLSGNSPSTGIVGRFSAPFLGGTMDRRLLLVALTLGTAVLGSGCGLNTQGNAPEANEVDSGFGGQGGNKLDSSTPDVDASKVDSSIDSSVHDSSVDQSIDTIADTRIDAVVEDVESGVGCWTGQKLCNNTCVPDDNPKTGCASSSCTACSFPHAQSTCASGVCAMVRSGSACWARRRCSRAP